MTLLVSIESISSLLSWEDTLLQDRLRPPLIKVFLNLSELLQTLVRS